MTRMSTTVTIAKEKIVRRISISTGSMIWLLFLAGPDRGRRYRGCNDYRQPGEKLEPSNRQKAKNESGAGRRAGGASFALRGLLRSIQPLDKLAVADIRIDKQEHRDSEHCQYHCKDCGDGRKDQPQH